MKWRPIFLSEVLRLPEMDYECVPVLEDLRKNNILSRLEAESQYHFVRRAKLP
jgi:hypothetical protein